MDKAIKVSVVIPARNRASQVEFCVETLTNQTLPKNQYEIIVVDDGSTDETVARLLPFKEKVNLKIVQTGRKDPTFRAALARNLGADQARGEILVFIDSDIVADPFLLEEHLKSHQKEKNISVIGYRFHLKRVFHHLLRNLIRKKAFDRLWQLPLRIDVRETGYKYSQAKELNQHPAPWRFYHSNNISLTRELFQRLGGFDDSFRGWGDEDLELGYRLWKNGVKFVLNRDAIGIHLDHSFDSKSRVDGIIENKRRFLLKHQDTQVELFNDFLPISEELLPELARLEKLKNSPLTGAGKRSAPISLPNKRKKVLIGTGQEINFKQTFSLAVDFRPAYLAAYQGPAEKINLLGYNLPYAENSFDLTVISHYLILFSDYFIFRIIAQALRLSGEVLIFEETGFLPKVLQICQSFAAAKITVRSGRRNGQSYVQLIKKTDHTNSKRSLGLFLSPFLNDYLTATSLFAEKLAHLKDLRGRIAQREQLCSLFDRQKDFFLLTSPQLFQEVWEKGLPDFKNIAGRFWQWFRREERVPEEESAHLYLEESNLFWLPGINLKWFSSEDDSFLRSGRKIADKYAFFIDGNIFADHRLEALAQKAGLDQKPAFLCDPARNDFSFLFQLTVFQRDLNKLQTLLSLLSKKTEGKPFVCHIYCFWENRDLAYNLPALSTGGRRWQKYLHSFELANQAAKEEQLAIIRWVGQQLRPTALLSRVKFYLVKPEEVEALDQEKHFNALGSLDEDSMMELVDTFAGQTENNDKTEKKLLRFINSIKPSAESLNIRACYYFLLSENFDKARVFLKKIKTKSYVQLFSVILKVEEGRYEEAIAGFKLLAHEIETVPRFIAAHLFAAIGVAYFETHQRALAFDLWEKVLGLDEENSLAAMSLTFKNLLQ